MTQWGNGKWKIVAFLLPTKAATTTTMMIITAWKVRQISLDDVADSAIITQDNRNLSYHSPPQRDIKTTKTTSNWIHRNVKDSLKPTAAAADVIIIKF